MDKQTTIDLTALLTTVAEISPAPESACYMAFRCDMARYERARDFLVGSGMVERNLDHSLTITDDGRAFADICNRALALAR